MKYFVVFKAEWDDEPIRHDVIKYHKEIDCKEDIENLEKLINEKWYEEDRYIAIINFKKCSADLPTGNLMETFPQLRFLLPR